MDTIKFGAIQGTPSHKKEPQAAHNTGQDLAQLRTAENPMTAETLLRRNNAETVRNRHPSGVIGETRFTVTISTTSTTAA